MPDLEKSDIVNPRSRKKSATAAAKEAVATVATKATPKAKAKAAPKPKNPPKPVGEKAQTGATAKASGKAAKAKAAAKDKAQDVDTPKSTKAETMLFQSAQDDFPAAGKEFSTLRVGKKWATRVKPGDFLKVKLAKKKDGKVIEDKETFGTFEVTKVERYANFRAALQASGRTNHYVLSGVGRSVSFLESQVRAIYGIDAIKKADGFVLVYMKAMPSPAEVDAPKEAEPT